jgi:tripartite-type tricarboxylate transporter receptor subunit TctC
MRIDNEREDDMKGFPNVTRRNFLASTGAGLAALSLTRPSWGQDFPSRIINVTIPTGEGGGADRDSRAFTSVWSEHLGANFEFGFFPGASGQVGYEHYLQRVEPDPHHLLSSYIGPEVIMLTLQADHIVPGEDFVYFQQFVEEPMAVYVGADSPVESIEHHVELGPQRPVNVSKSRLPHPASICMLSLGEATGTEMNLIPFGGGNPASMAAIGGEVDCCALPISLPISLGDQVRILGVFAATNPVPAETGNAPTVNDALGLDLPHLTSARSWAIHSETIERFPDEYEIIRQTARQTAEDPAFVEAMASVGVPAEFVNTGGEEVAMAAAKATADLANRYRELLTGDT